MGDLLRTSDPAPFPTVTQLTPPWTPGLLSATPSPVIPLRAYPRGRRPHGDVCGLSSDRPPALGVSGTRPGLSGAIPRGWHGKCGTAALEGQRSVVLTA